MRPLFKLLLIVSIIIEITFTTVLWFRQVIVGSIFPTILSVIVLMALGIALGLEETHSYNENLREQNKILEEENKQFHNELNEAKKRLIDAALKLEEK